MPTYKDAGVDIHAADDAKKIFQKSLDRGDPRVLNSVGAFASLVQGKFDGYEDPVLVLKTEEPGSKQKLAFGHGYIPSICFDTVNHLINDIAVMGAFPLYVQDAIICGKLEKAMVVKIVDGFAKACEEQGCALVGGETSEQPGVLEPGTYILVANIVGIVERSKIIDGSKIAEGDLVLGLASHGLHTNGFSLVRSLLAKHPSLLQEKIDGEPFLSALMKPHRCYLSVLKDLFSHTGIHGMAHITCGGIGGNLNRILPPNLNAEIDLSTIDIPTIFKRLREIGSVPDDDMLRTFNIGIGLTLVVDPDAVSEIQMHLASHHVNSSIIGIIEKGEQKVTFKGALRY